MSDSKVDKGIFYPALILIVVLVTPLIVFKDASNVFLGKLLGVATGGLGWSFLWFTIGAFFILAWLALGRFGNVRFGGEDARPQFSLGSWIAMLFCAGIGASVLYWGTIEWIYYYQGPPFGIEAETDTAREWAAMYGLFHWGFTAWAVYCIPTLPMAYMLWNKKRAVLRLSAACEPVIGKKNAAGWPGKVIDLMFMFGLIGGIGTSMGLGTPMLSAGISELFGVERSFMLDVIVVLIWGAIFGASVYSGLEKGIKVLSDVNLWLIIIILGFTFLFGPTLFMLDTFTNSIGLLVSNFVQMSFWTDPIGNGGFPEAWTIFYWAWWIAFAPFMGLFVARISYGRTIRQLIVVEVLGGSFGCWLFFAVLGNTGMYFDMNGIVNLSEILSNQDGAAAVVATVKGVGDNATFFGMFSLGFVTPLLLVIFIVLAFIFGATTLDSSAFTLASVATAESDDANSEPARWHRLFWAITLAVVSLSLMYLGGLKPLQTASIVVGIPLMGVLVIMTISFFRMLEQDYPSGDKETDITVDTSENLDTDIEPARSVGAAAVKLTKDQS